MALIQIILLGVLLILCLLLLFGCFIRLGKMVKMTIFLAHRNGVSVEDLLLANRRFGEITDEVEL